MQKIQFDFSRIRRAAASNINDKLVSKQIRRWNIEKKPAKVNRQACILITHYIYTKQQLSAVQRDEYIIETPVLLSSRIAISTQAAFTSSTYTRFLEKKQEFPQARPVTRDNITWNPGERIKNERETRAQLISLSRWLQPKARAHGITCIANIKKHRVYSVAKKRNRDG